MADTGQENGDKGVRTKKQSVIEIPTPARLDIPDDTQTKNGSLPSRSRRSVWFGNSFGPLGKYGKLKKTQFVIGARNLEVCYTEQNNIFSTQLIFLHTIVDILCFFLNVCPLHIA
jgi:hypothetical protein